MRSCPTCESTSLSWTFALDAYPGAHLGRLTLRDVRAVYVLGCDECSATATTVHADDPAVLAALDGPPAPS